MARRKQIRFTVRRKELCEPYTDVLKREIAKWGGLRQWGEEYAALSAYLHYHDVTCSPDDIDFDSVEIEIKAYMKFERKNPSIEAALKKLRGVMEYMNDENKAAKRTLREISEFAGVAYKTAKKWADIGALPQGGDRYFNGWRYRVSLADAVASLEKFGTIDSKINNK